MTPHEALLFNAKMCLRTSEPGTPEHQMAIDMIHSVAGYLDLMDPKFDKADFLAKLGLARDN